MARTRGPKRARVRKVPKNCFFCGEKKEPGLKEVGSLQKFLTERGKIIPRSRSGICGKHQRNLARNIKYARHLGLLPFVSRG